MTSVWRPALSLFVLLTALTGLAYPLAVTAVAQAVFPRQAHGSLVTVDGKVVGSELIGQTFSGDKYLWSRPSATSPTAYNAAASSGSNLGPTNPALADAVNERVARLQQSTRSATSVPVDLVTASASGLDPHITPAAAEFQVERIAKVRAVSADAVRAVIAKHTAQRTLGLFGEPRVNVLLVNLDLDREGR